MRTTFFLSGLILVPGFSAHAGDTANSLGDIINRVETVYGVQKLKKARTIRIEEDRRVEYPSHDYSPEFYDLSSQRVHHIIDIDGERGSSEYLTLIGGSSYHGRQVLAGGQTWFIDYGIGNYENTGENSFYDYYGPAFRASDTLIAFSLSEARESAVLDGEVVWHGWRHDRITFDFPNSPPLTAFVRRKDGVITKMERSIPGGPTVYYTFKDHVREGGVLTAREHAAYAGDRRLYFSMNRKTDLNDRHDRKAFEIEADILEEPDRMNREYMQVSEVPTAGPEKVFQVGQGGSNTAFVETGGLLIAYGTEAGFAERFAAYSEKTGSDLELSYAIVVDHHRSEMAGALEAARLGADIVTTQGAEARIREMLAGESPVTDIQTVDAKTNLNDLEVYAAATDHASEVLIAWIEPSRLLLQSNHFDSPYISEPFYAKYAAVSLFGALSNMSQIQPEATLSTAGHKVISWDEFSEAVKNYDDTKCFRGRLICDD